jgi:ATP-dependent RNA circularization protein (DNA/RNA ligase family)
LSSFHRFPHTPHLAWLGAAEPRGDKVLSANEVTSLLADEVAVEEKVDGANLGFSLSPLGELRVQNRGQYLAQPHAGQFCRLPAWLALHGNAVGDVLLEHVDQGLVLFGEWCAARHSLDYTRLPDWFLLFDVFEATTGRFWSSNRRNTLASDIGLATTPRLAHGYFTLSDLTVKIQQWTSRFRDGPLEGIVVRSESDEWCERRAKLVCGDFTQGITGHWRNRQLQWNRLATALTS